MKSGISLQRSITLNYQQTLTPQAFTALLDTSQDEEEPIRFPLALPKQPCYGGVFYTIDLSGTAVPKTYGGRRVWDCMAAISTDIIVSDRFAPQASADCPRDITTLVDVFFRTRLL